MVTKTQWKMSRRDQVTKEAAVAGAGGGAGSKQQPAPRSEPGGAGTGVKDGGVRAGCRAGGAGRSCASSERVIRFKTCLRNTISDVLRSRGWQEVKEGESDWDFYWCDVTWMREHFDQIYLEEHQRVCHFRNHYELTRKNLMAKNLKRLRKSLEKESKVEAAKCDFFPTTFELPSEYHIFVEEFKRRPGTIWIMKPAGKAQGKGIFLFRKLKDITDWKKEDYFRRDEEKSDKEPPETYVVQRYIDNPYLISGKKFDIRIYILVTSYSPLKAWLYRSGFARFSNTHYSLSSISDQYVHLTNVAIQKTAPDYDPEKGCKWSLQELMTFLTARHGYQTVRLVQQQMDEIYIKSLQSVQKVMINDKHCFELYGFDILFDKNLKPWIIEVNASPSLTASSPSDYDLKFGLLEDMLHVLDMEGRLSGREGIKRIGGFDLIWNDGPVASDELSLNCGRPLTYTTNSFLGCYNNREQQLKQLFNLSAAAQL